MDDTMTTTHGLAHLPGRCPVCGYHAATQGHDPGCTYATDADRARDDARLAELTTLAAAGDPDAQLDLEPLVCQVCGARPPDIHVVRYARPWYAVRCLPHRPTGRPRRNAQPGERAHGHEGP
jgi:hypothetical protein